MTSNKVQSVIRFDSISFLFCLLTLAPWGFKLNDETIFLSVYFPLMFTSYSIEQKDLPPKRH